MAICVGCGLEVNAGLLEVNVCGDPVIPNTTTGGLQCDPNTEGGCLKVVLNDSHAGCGLNANGGALEVDPCLNGGILCGATDDDPEDNCIYVNVQGQGGGPCVTYDAGTHRPNGDCGVVDSNAVGVVAANFPNGIDNSGCPSPNCNGLVRTCEGLWSPPALASINFSCGQLSTSGGTIADVRDLIRGEGANVSSPPGDGFPVASNDFVFRSPGNAGIGSIIVNAFEYDGCNPIDAMSWTAFNLVMTINGGEVWRFLLHERICLDVNIDVPCGGGWALQAAQYADFRGQPTGVASIQINDNSTWRFGQVGSARMEAMISFQRVVGGPTANATNPLIYSNFQYRNMGHAYHHSIDQNCGAIDTA